jgi:hypothetical protein
MRWRCRGNRTRQRRGLPRANKITDRTKEREVQQGRGEEETVRIHWQENARRVTRTRRAMYSGERCFRSSSHKRACPRRRAARSSC